MEKGDSFEVYSVSERFIDDPGLRLVRRAVEEDRLRYAAASYLDEWIATDLPCHEVLGTANSKKQSSDGPIHLLSFAKAYGVIRTLPIKAGEHVRLAQAYKSLLEIDSPSDIEGAISRVDDLAIKLRKDYGNGKTPLSAASKFLWVRFQSPVIIYDSVVREWLRNKGTGYSGYCEAWLSEYQKHEDKIARVCEDLKTIKRFTLASGIDDSQVSSWVERRWFRERVFDHYIQNESTWDGVIARFESRS